MPPVLDEISEPHMQTLNGVKGKAVGAYRGDGGRQTAKAYGLVTGYGYYWSEDQACSVQAIENAGAPGGIRTPNPQIRSLMLCPVELRALGFPRH